MWVLCPAGLTLELLLLPSLLSTPPLGPLPGVPGDPMGVSVPEPSPQCQGQTVLGQTPGKGQVSVLPWLFPVPGSVTPQGQHILRGPGSGDGRIAQVSSHLALARIHPALGTLWGSVTSPLTPLDKPFLGFCLVFTNWG